MHPRDSRDPLNRVLNDLILSFNFFTWPYTAPPRENYRSAIIHLVALLDPSNKSQFYCCQLLNQSLNFTRLNHHLLGIHIDCIREAKIDNNSPITGYKKKKKKMKLFSKSQRTSDFGEPNYIRTANEEKTKEKLI